VAAWREQVLGARAPWEPVLLAVAGDRLQAYTGRRLVLQLVRLLGVRRGLALASELGTLASPVARGPVLTRRRALRRLAGLGTALGLLASGKVAVPGGAHAQGAGRCAALVGGRAGRDDPARSGSQGETSGGTRGRP